MRSAASTDGAFDFGPIRGYLDGATWREYSPGCGPPTWSGGTGQTTRWQGRKPDRIDCFFWNADTTRRPPPCNRDLVAVGAAQRAGGPRWVSQLVSSPVDPGQDHLRCLQRRRRRRFTSSRGRPPTAALSARVITDNRFVFSTQLSHRVWTCASSASTPRLHSLTGPVVRKVRRWPMQWLAPLRRRLTRVARGTTCGGLAERAAGPWMSMRRKRFVGDDLPPLVALRLTT